MHVISATQSWFGPSTILSRARSANIGPLWPLSVVTTNRLRCFGCKSCSGIRRRIFLINGYPLMAKLSANPAIAISLKFIADRGDGSDDLSVVAFTGGAS